MHRITVPILLLICIVMGCKSQKYTYAELPPEQIVFGQGGGMAGGIKTYTLLENGQLFVYNSITGESEALTDMDAERAREFFTKLDGLSFDSILFDHPGNRYYFLGRKTDAGEHRTVWGSDDHQVPAPIKNIYKELITAIK